MQVIHDRRRTYSDRIIRHMRKLRQRRLPVSHIAQKLNIPYSVAYYHTHPSMREYYRAEQAKRYKEMRKNPRFLAELRRRSRLQRLRRKRLMTLTGANA